MKKHLITHAFAFVVGVLSCILFTNATAPEHIPASRTAKYTEAQFRELRIINVSYAKAIDSVNRRNANLQTQVEAVKSDLQRSKRDRGLLERKIRNYSNLQSTTADTLERLTACDSLASTVDSMLTLVSAEDSIHTELLTLCEQRVQLKDSVEIIHLSHIEKLNNSLVEVIAQNTDLAVQLENEKRNQKKEKRRKRVFACIAVVLSGLFIADHVK